MHFVYHFTNQWLHCYRANVSFIISLNQSKSRSGQFTLKMYDEGGINIISSESEGECDVSVTKNLKRACNANKSQIVSY